MTQTGLGALDRNSNSKILIKLGDSTVRWKTLKQNCVALSTTEEEYISITEAAKMLIWIGKLLSELRCMQSNATTLHADNPSEISWETEGVRNAEPLSIPDNFVKEQCKLKRI